MTTSDQLAPAERLERLVAEGLARADGESPSPAHEAQARRLLTEHAFRHLHNEVAEIRREAVAEHMRGLRPPLGFWGVAAACFLAVIVAALIGLFLAARPALLSFLLALMGT